MSFDITSAQVFLALYAAVPANVLSLFVIKQSWYERFRPNYIPSYFVYGLMRVAAIIVLIAAMYIYLLNYQPPGGVSSGFFLASFILFVTMNATRKLRLILFTEYALFMWSMIAGIVALTLGIALTVMLATAPATIPMVFMIFYCGWLLYEVIFDAMWLGVQRRHPDDAIQPDPLPIPALGGGNARYSADEGSEGEVEEERKSRSSTSARQRRALSKINNF